MKFIAALSLLTATASANPFAPATSSTDQHAKLLSKARVLRELNDNNQYQPNIAPYYMKFEKCQFVKAYDDELAENEDAPTVLATQRFVIFRLRPTDACSTACNYNYGEYIIDLESYLESTVQYAQENQENMCKACEEYCQNNNNNGRKLQDMYNTDCYTCVDECEKIENMEDNGYIDATEFLECQMIYDPEDDNRQALYAGPICASQGTKIKIGVFKDEDCLFVDSEKEVEDYLVNGDGAQMLLSHALLKMTYTDTCMSCKEVEEDQNGNNNNNANDQEDEDKTIEMCERLYEEAAKCETPHGITDSFTNYYMYGNQAAQEEAVCTFMKSIELGTYDEQGEIIVSGSASKTGANTTGGQKFALTFFILGTVGLAAYAAMLHSKLVKGGKSDLSSSGGAMA